MKKILGISLVAVLAATPLMASAADLTQTEMGHATVLTGDNNKMATVSYVKGAYTELGTAINTKADKTALESEASARELADQGLQSAINTLNGDDQTEGSVDYKIDQAISEVNGAAGNLSNLTTDEKRTLVGAINEVDEHTDTNTAAITLLNGNAETAGSVAYAVAQEASARQSADNTLQDNIDAEATTRQNADTAINNKIGNTTMTTTNQTLTGAIEEVKQSVSTLSGAANTTYAKKVGVTQTITNSTISGTVPVVTDWANQTAGTVAINATITGAEYAEPTTTDEPTEIAG